MGRMDGKVALVTGAARGMGRAHAVRLAEEGADILALDCPPDTGLPYPTATAEDLQITVKEVESFGRRIIAHEGDVRKQSSLDKLVAEGVKAFGGLDVAVANAGIWTVQPFADISEDEFSAVLDVNITGVWRTLKAVTPAMKERGGGSIVVTSSGNGVEGSPHYAHYVASKHGVIGVAKSAALEFGQYGIRVNILLPGPSDTPALDWQGGDTTSVRVRAPDRGSKRISKVQNTGPYCATSDCSLRAP